MLVQSLQAGGIEDYRVGIALTKVLDSQARSRGARLSESGGL